MVVHQHLILLQFSPKKKMYVRLHFPFSPRLKRLICLFITTATTLVYHQSLILLQGLFSSMINRNCSTVVLLCGGEISNTTRRYDQKMPTQQASFIEKKKDEREIENNIMHYQPRHHLRWYLLQEKKMEKYVHKKKRKLIFISVITGKSFFLRIYSTTA